MNVHFHGQANRATLCSNWAQKYLITLAYALISAAAFGTKATALCKFHSSSWAGAATAHVVSQERFPWPIMQLPAACTGAAADSAGSFAGLLWSNPRQSSSSCCCCCRFDATCVRVAGPKLAIECLLNPFCNLLPGGRMIKIIFPRKITFFPRTDFPPDFSY